MRIRIFLCVLMLGLVMLLTGCNMQTVDKLYCIPKRSEAFNDLQRAIDSAMSGMAYSAPISGEHQQSVQLVDITGDGNAEYLVFVKSSGAKPLQILIFAENGKDYYLMDTIYCSGYAFEQVEYVRMDRQSGYEIIVCTQVGEQVLRSVSGYSYKSNRVEQFLSVSCSKFLCYDLDDDGAWELMTLSPGENDVDCAVAQLFSYKEGNTERYAEAVTSSSVDSVKRLVVGNLEDGSNAIFVASSLDERRLVTDIFALKNGIFVNICKTNHSDTTVETLRNYYVYADDIDDDGIMELPQLFPMDAGAITQQNQHLICWYSVTSDGQRVDKAFTYHNFVGGWYLELDIPSIERVSIAQQGNAYDFYFWDKSFENKDRIFSVYVLVGQDRDEQANAENRFVIHRAESSVYAAKLDFAAATYGITKEKMIRGFHLILQDWRTGET